MELRREKGADFEPRIGVDDMFVLLSGLAGAQDKGSVEDKIAETMRTSGVAITVTSVSNLLAFVAGTSSIFLSVRNFCIYTGVAVIFCYLNQATLFLPCLTLHKKRVESNRHFMTCLPVVTKEEATDEKRSGMFILCCTRSPPKSRTEAEGFLDKFPGWLIPKIVLKLPSKILILLIFAEYLAVSIYGITIKEQGLELKFFESLFLAYPRYQKNKNDIVIDTVHKRITASRFYVMSENFKSTTQQAQLMLNMHDVAKSSSISIFAFSPAFIYYEQYVAVFPQTLQTVGIAVLIVFLVTVLFMPHPLLLIYVTITVLMIMVGILGFLPFLGLTVSSITMIHIIMSVGFSVDYAAHICHGFMISDSSTPIFHGAASSFLGIITLAAATSYIFKSFFRVMVLVIAFGLVHGLFFLPVVLSLIGPHKTKSDKNYSEV